MDNKKHLYELMENFFHDCSVNGLSDFKVWCEDNIDTLNVHLCEKCAARLDADILEWKLSVLGNR